MSDRQNVSDRAPTPAPLPAPVTVLGLGPMGQALARAFLKGGHPTTVWNRTTAKADALVAEGARRADTPAAAAAASPLVVVCVLDDRAVHAIVEPAAEALRGRTLVNLTADTPARARELAAWAAERGIDYLDGAIMTPTVTIGGPGAVVLYSGPEDVYQAHRASLASLGGTATHLGSDPGRAAAHEIALLDLFWTSMSGLAHAFALARAEGVTATALAPLAQSIGTVLSGVIPGFAADVDAGHYPGEDSNLRSAAAGMEHILHTAQSHGLDSTVLSAALALTRRAISAGHADDGFARITEVVAASPH